MHMGMRCILFPLRNTSQASVLVKFLCTRVGLSGPGPSFLDLVTSVAPSSGSWNSIIPCLALRGVAPAIARSRSLRAKVLFCT